jgi:uncharacterized protein
VANKEEILRLIKESVQATAPDAVLILYGSYARGDNRLDSDIDLLVLVNQDVVTYDDEKKIKYPLYHLEYETGVIISPMVMSKQKWATHRVTPFYENVVNEGVVL